MARKKKKRYQEPKEQLGILSADQIHWYIFLLVTSILITARISIG